MSATLSDRTGFQKWAWLFPFILGVLLLLNVVGVALIPQETVFESDTGVAWSEFEAAYPTVAEGMLIEQRLNFAGQLGLALFTVSLAAVGVRAGDRKAWVALWLVPIMLLVNAVIFFLGASSGLGIFYVVLAALAVVCQVVTMKSVGGM